MLDRFISGCVNVVGDDGLWQGMPDKDGYSRIQEPTPEFLPQNLEVEWKSLPVNEMYEILNFPVEIENANSIIDSTFEHAASPPDFSEGFEERQYQYSILGCRANDLANKLRKLSKLPEKNAGEWDAIEYMKQRKKKIDEVREERRLRIEEMRSNFQAIEKEK